MFFLLLLFALLGLSLLFFIILLLLTSPKKYIDDNQSVEIVKVVESHRKILPICSLQGWSLVCSSHGLRCWKKELSFVIMGSPITVFGCSKQIDCTAVTVLNVIADISTWPEWDFWAEGQTVHLEVAEDPLLHGDRYMQCDQLVVTTSTIHAKPDVVMYRFGNLESNGVGWILLWNAKCLEWTFYLAQPIDSCSSDNESDSSLVERCMLSAISGSDQTYYSDKALSEKLSAKVQNLCDAIRNSHFKVRPLQPLIKSSSTLNNPHFPAIHSALSDLPEKPCVLLKFERTRHFNPLQNCVLAVVPSMKSGKIYEFQLISRVLKESSNGDLPSDAILPAEEKRRSRRRLKIRSDSVSTGSPLIKHLQAESRRSSSLSAPLIRKKLPELMVTKAEDELHMPERAASHSFLNLIFPRRRSSEGSEKKSDSRCSSPAHVRRKKALSNSSSASSQEDIAGSVFVTGRFNDESASDTMDASLLYLDDGGDKDYKTLGEFCVRALLKENLKASLVDIHVSEEEQKKVSGGWSFKELNKDVTVLKKMSTTNSNNVVISYLCKGLIPSSCKIVWKTLCNPSTRFMYDDTVKKISVLAEFPPDQKLIHMYNESVTFLKREVQDFCLLQTEKEEEKKLILAFHSVNNELCPPVKDVVRGTVITSGWVVEKVPEMPNATILSYLMQMIVTSPDNQMMEEITNIQCQCMNNLSTYLATKPII